MKVRELIEALKRVDPELDVVTATTDIYGDEVTGLEVVTFQQKWEEDLEDYISRYTKGAGFKALKLSTSLSSTYLNPIKKPTEE